MSGLPSRELAVVLLSGGLDSCVTTAIAALFGLGVFEAHVARIVRVRQLMSGVGAAGTGFLIVIAEALFRPAAK